MIKEIIAFAGGYRLRNLKSMTGMDGLVWNACLYLNNRKLGVVGDEGYGGGLRYDISHDDLQALIAYAKTKVQAETAHADIFVTNLADYTETITNLKHQAETAVLVVVDDKLDENGVPVYHSKFGCPPTPENVVGLKKNFPHYRWFADEIALWT